MTRGKVSFGFNLLELKLDCKESFENFGKGDVLGLRLARKGSRENAEGERCRFSDQYLMI